LMKILSGASLPSQYTFLIQFLFKIDENPLWSLPPTSSTHSLFNSYSKLMQILSGASLPPNTYSLFNSYSKLMKILSGASFHPSICIYIYIYILTQFYIFLFNTTYKYIYIYIYTIYMRKSKR
jgi:hypothetical protein